MNIHRAERIWMTFGIAILIVFLGVITFAAVADGINPPSRVQSIDPTKVSTTPPFDNPGLRKTGPNEYEVYYVARIFSFTPRHIEIPAGAHVRFFATSADVEHGFSIPETDVNMMVTPGWVNEVAHTFKRPGKYLLVCNEYCGTGHQLMAADVEVK